jgi:hypothetical protein
MVSPQLPAGVQVAGLEQVRDCLVTAAAAAAAATAAAAAAVAEEFGSLRMDMLSRKPMCLIPVYGVASCVHAGGILSPQHPHPSHANTNPTLTLWLFLCHHPPQLQVAAGIKTSQLEAVSRPAQTCRNTRITPNANGNLPQCVNPMLRPGGASTDKMLPRRHMRTWCSYLCTVELKPYKW